MRVAIVSDIHGNLTALEAVIADLRQVAPDVVLHGGDLTDTGSSPVAVVDRIHELGWRGVMGNTDEMLFRPASLVEFAEQAPALKPLLPAIEEMAAGSRDKLGDERVAWLSELPRRQICGPIALIHASPESLWRAPAAQAGDDELASVYSPLGATAAAYGHIHCGFVRRIARGEGAPELMVANAGSVGLSYDGDTRAAYLVLDVTETSIDATLRRVEYDLEREIRARAVCGLPHAEWIGKTLRSATPQMPG